MNAAPHQPWRWLRAAAALTATTALLAGLPYALARFIGWPLPRHLPTWPRLRLFLTTPLGDDTIIKGLACVVWLLWAIFALSLIIGAVSAVRGHPAPRLPVIAPIQAFAAALVGATMLTAIPVTQAGARASPLPTVLTAQTVAPAPSRSGQPFPALADTATASSATATGRMTAQTPPAERQRPRAVSTASSKATTCGISQRATWATLNDGTRSSR